MNRKNRDKEWDNDSILMSEELYDDIEDLTEDTLKIIKNRSRIIIIKTIKSGKPDVIFGILNSICINEHDNKICFKLSCETNNAINFAFDIKFGNTTIHGVEMHHRNNVTNILNETNSNNPLRISICNVSDIETNKEYSTLTIELDY
jgi:hypothetical protein